MLYLYEFITRQLLTTNEQIDNKDEYTSKVPPNWGTNGTGMV